jgi:hypothetical protein
VQELLSLVARTCPDRDPIVGAAVDPVDWRRVMWYLPSAYALEIVDGTVSAVARHTDVAPIPVGGLEVRTECPMIWLVSEHESRGLVHLHSPATLVPGLGWTASADSVRVTPKSVDLRVGTR